MKVLFLIFRLLFVLLFLYINSGDSQTKCRVGNIHISTDNSIFTERYILDNISSKQNDLLSDSKLKNDISKIASLFSSECYYSAIVKINSLVYSNDSSLVDVNISVVSNGQSLIKTLEIGGNTAFTKDEILNRWESKIGSCLIQAKLETDLENLISRYENSGYPFVSVKVGKISYADTSSSQLIVQVDVDECPKVKIDRIEVEGNTDTKSDVVIRETRMRQGEVYNSERVKNIPRLLNRLKIFSSVNEPALYLIPDTSRKIQDINVQNNPFQSLSTKEENGIQSGGLLIKVVEGSTNTFDGVVGYLPGSLGEKGYFTGLVDVGLRNLFGTGRKLSVKWMREDKLSQEIGIRYVEPWLFDYPISLSGSFYQRQQDTTYIKRTTELKSDFLISENFTLSGMFSQENIIPSSEIANQYIQSSGTTSGGVEIHYDSRDDIYNPTSGVNYRSDYYIGRKKIYSLKQNLTMQRVGLDVELFSEPFSRQVAAIGLHGRELRSDYIEISDLYRFGGTNTMRGYRENQFIGSIIVWTNLEYRFLMARHSFFFGFFDFGYYFHPAIAKANITSSYENAKYGYGIGMRIETGLGIIGVSFAFGKGDSFSQAKLHFGLINDF
jgi:outer membrane protein insertion porin family